MSTHGMAKNGTHTTHRQLCFNKGRKLVHDVAVHAVMGAPRRLCGIHIKPGTQPEIVGLVCIVRHALTARAGVRHHNGNTQLGGNALSACLGGKVLVCTGQSRKPVQHRYALTGLRLWRQVNTELHGAVQCGRHMLILVLQTTKTLNAANGFHIRNESLCGWICPRASNRRLH